jgi:hypothetical protein
MDPFSECVRGVPPVSAPSAQSRRLAILGPAKDNCRTVFVSREGLPTRDPED